MRFGVAQPPHLSDLYAFPHLSSRFTNLRALRPGQALVKVLSEKGINVVASKYTIDNKRFFRNPFQETAVHMLVKGSAIDTRSSLSRCRLWYKECLDGRCVTYALRGGSEVSDATHSQEGDIKVDDIRDLVTEYPKIGIYMGFMHLHTLDELRKLRMQLREALNAVRTFLWDEHLILLNLPVGVEDVGIGSNLVKKGRIEEIDSEDTILLDPNAEAELNSNELMTARHFVFGGIVDKIVPRPGLTSKIPCISCKRRKITLRGSVIGVPQIIHKLIYAVLRARFELGGNLESAIIEVMSSREKRWRIAKEMIEAYREGKDPLWRALEVARWLRASCKDVIHAAKMSGLRVNVNEIQAEYCSENGS